MSYELSDTERNAALQLNADYRYDHFISKVAQHQQLWTLKDEKGLLLLESEGDARDSAPRCATEHEWRASSSTAAESGLPGQYNE